MAWNIFVLEKETGKDIRKDYPLMKFFSLMENLIEQNEKERRELSRVK
jgi:hypothetical protein